MTHFFYPPPEPNFYHDSNFDIDAVKILPGEYYVTTRPMLIVTVLGSCVAACVRDTGNGIGGMNHFLLPNAVEFGGTEAMCRQYGEYAMEVLIDQMLSMGAKREHLEAKIFGGSNILRDFTRDKVGERNALFLRQWLDKRQIPIVADSMLGRYPRKVYFFPETGNVKIKKLVRLHNETITKREKAYRQRLLESSPEQIGFNRFK